MSHSILAQNSGMEIFHTRLSVLSSWRSVAPRKKGKSFFPNLTMREDSAGGEENAKKKKKYIRVFLSLDLGKQGKQNEPRSLAG